MRPLKRPRLFQHLEAHAGMAATLRSQREVDQVLAAALAADDRISYCHQLGLSWPAARRYLWSHSQDVLDLAARRLQAARAELASDWKRLDKGQTAMRENEINRLASLWAVRYLNGF